jgi:hypothetical protein
MDRLKQQTQPQPRRVLIGTPCYDGRIEVWYANSLVQTIKIAEKMNIEITPIWLSYDALVQRARNDLMGIMIEAGFDDIVFIDADIDWQPEDFFKLLNYPVDVVGGTYPKKGDLEQYVAKIIDPQRARDSATGLLSTEGLGTGFLRMSRAAVQYLWDTCVPYQERDQGKDRRWIFDVIIDDNGELVSEDILACQRLIEGGFPIWLDISITCGHTGVKRFTGNFESWFARLQSSIPQTGYGMPQMGSTPPDIKSLYE